MDRAEVAREGGVSLADRPQQLDQSFCDVALEVAVAVVAGRYVVGPAAGGRGQQLEQVGDAGLGLGS